MLTKQEAELEAIRRWNLLPEHERDTYEQAEAYALRLDLELAFPSIMEPRKLIAAWLIREVTTKRRFERESRIAAERIVVAAELADAIAALQAPDAAVEIEQAEAA